MSDITCKHGNLTRSCMRCNMDRLAAATALPVFDTVALKQKTLVYSNDDDPTGLIESGYRVVDRSVEPGTGEQCDDCGEWYRYNYRVPDDVWKQIAPHQDTGGLLCLGCADQRARGLGIKLYFEGTPDWWRE